jgi:hypothetical protein
MALAFRAAAGSIPMPYPMMTGSMAKIVYSKNSREVDDDESSTSNIMTKTNTRMGTIVA